MAGLEPAYPFFPSISSQVIMLLLGGFSIAAALSKHFIAKWVAHPSSAT